MKISINNPCHENWDAMTPNEKGAFCSVCRKTVIDFSVKTVEEIKNFFAELPQTEKVCGRFDKVQLDEINFDSFFKQFSKWSYSRKTAVIFFFIFGFGLFGHAQTTNSHMGLKGEVAIVVKQDTSKNKIKDPVKITPPKDKQHIMGGPRYVPEEHPKDKPKEKLMGKPAINRNPH